ANPGLDLKVLALLDDDTEKIGHSIEGVPVIRAIADAPELQHSLHVAYGIVAMPGVDPAQLASILQRYASVFPHLVMVPNMFGLSSVGVGTRDFAGIVGLYNKQNLLLPHNRILKKMADAALLFPIGLIALPVIALGALALWLVDRGNPFYAQRREGHHGKPVFIWKLRTMRRDADAYLQRHPE